jgi:hypothetical protein
MQRNFLLLASARASHARTFRFLPCRILNDDLQTGLLLGRELRLNQPMQMRRDRRLIEPLNDFVQETGDDEALRDFCWDPT